MAATYEPIYTTTLGSNQTSITLNSFGGYTDLRIVCNVKITGIKFELDTEPLIRYKPVPPRSPVVRRDDEADDPLP